MNGASGRPDSAEAEQSYWAATTNGAASHGAFSGAAECDVVIVGGGFTGLSTAYHLHKAGKSCILVDARQPGWGASGRNGGMVVPRYKATYPELAAKFGTEGALELYKAAHAAVDTLEDVVSDCGIDCGFARTGHLTPFEDEANEGRFAADIAWLSEIAGDTYPKLLDASGTAERLGTGFYRGAYLEPRGGGIHPLQYCTGLAAWLSGNGVPLFGDTPATNWRREGETFVVTVPGGTLRCRMLVLATNGYSDTTPAGRRLSKRIIPVVSSIIATEPLPPDVASQILPSALPVTDAKRLTNYYRRFSDNRLLFGGRGGAGSRVSPAVYARLMRDAVRIYPQLAGVRPEFSWSGRVAVTLDSLPRIGVLEPGVFYAMGFSGRGVALATFMGRMLADAISGEDLRPEQIARLPFPEIPFHALRLPAKQAMILWYKLLDSMGR